ncbi:aldehyde dehydrogenase family protein [Mucilaginibacter psychrotolerans]|uniref:Aldehyde dehydrogenase n=1 Tax=Mucilaginibacter psychrotolerans TaxID=1524096 RepID=A0A4Y8SAT6_9SPHI|nr:aldehyde dehydrogenase family protein [Mucilaginibacter psychrotolerans]TFF36193.1 aldehyde dehydrogenase [Mucilaginibacter psychrotolerans]
MNTSSERRQKLNKDIIPNLEFRPFIGGSFINLPSDNVMPVIDPYTGNVIITVPHSGEREANLAVEAARHAFDKGPWPNLHPRERANYMVKLANIIDKNIETIALVETLDTGRPFKGALGWEIPNASEVFRYYAGWADKITGCTLPDVAGVNIETYQEPVGVCAAIMPWNFPFAALAWKIAPALAAGCTVVVKASERAPLTTLLLATYVSEANFPAGVINIIAGTGDTAGNALVKNRDVDKISFTGSTSTAQQIIQNSLGHLPGWSLELGGKSANVILNDANLQDAAQNAIGAMFTMSGQDCGAGSRLLLERNIAKEFLSILIPLIKSRRLGDPMDDATEQGPLIDHNQFERVSEYVDEARKSGANILIGGSGTKDGPNFYHPTLITDIPQNARIVREEIFGPVATVHLFDGLDEAISIANDSCYSLGAAIWTTSAEKAQEFRRKIRTGTVWLNCYGWYDTVSPWGGRGLSGQGKELGKEGLSEFLTTKAVFRK